MINLYMGNPGVANNAYKRCLLHSPRNLNTRRFLVVLETSVGVFCLSPEHFQMVRLFFCKRPKPLLFFVVIDRKATTTGRGTES